MFYVILTTIFYRFGSSHTTSGVVSVSVVFRSGEIGELQMLYVFFGVRVDEKRKFIRFVGQGESGGFIGSEGGSLGGSNLDYRLPVKIVISGVCQSVAFFRACTFTYDVYVFGVAGAVGTYQTHL